MLNEFYIMAFRRKIYAGIEQLQRDLDAWSCRRDRSGQQYKFDYALFAPGTEAEPKDLYSMRLSAHHF